MKWSITIFLLFSFTLISEGQGCNDAGICTLGSLPGKHLSEIPAQYLVISTSYALGEQNTSILTSEIKTGFRLNKRLMAEIAMPFSIISGKLGTVSGLNDITSRIIFESALSQKSSIKIFLAGKFPASQANKKMKGLDLPMVYQTSLGTYDFLIMGAWVYQSWSISAGYQHPFNHNMNEFQPDLWSPELPVKKYFPSYHLKRGDDITLRIDHFFIGENQGGSLSLIPVYRIKESKIYQNENWTPLENSDGLTLNVSASWYKVFKNNMRFTFLLAGPVLTRQVRPDGLTRSFIASIKLLFPVTFYGGQVTPIFHME